MSESQVAAGDVIIRTRKLTKEFARDSFRIVALKDADLDVNRGDFIALMGPSGSGKSTLLHLSAAMDRPTSGDIEVLGQSIGTMGESAVARWRNRHVGFVFQSFNLIPVLTALENVELPLKLTHLKKGERDQHARMALKLVGLEDRMHHYPKQLSGGQEQRVAIARAIVTDPDILLCDEPTGNLDAHSAQEVLTLLKRLNAEHDKTVLMVTHDPHAAHFARHIRYLDKGELLPEGHVPEDWRAPDAH